MAPGSEDDGWIVPPPVALRDGTRIQLYKDGEALRAAYEAIQSAQRRIFLESYIFADDETGRAFADALAAKAQEGVRVYVIYDSFGTRGLTGAEPPMFRQMRHAGVRVQQFHPLRPWECKFGWRPVNRDHRKLLLVDDDIAGLGGLNVGAEYAGSWVAPSSREECDLWRDNAIGIRGPSSRLFRQAFARMWHYVMHGGRMHRAEFIDGIDPESPGGAPELGVFASVPTLNSPLSPSLCKLMGRARRSILMTMAYFVPDDPLIEELCKAARRGARVRLMLPGRCDVRAVHVAARSFYETLLSCGVEIHERQGVVLHSKTMVVDGETTVIGSTNLDYRSIEYNCEISAVVHSATFGQQMHQLFEHDVRFAKKIELTAWRRRPWLDRCGQWAVSRARYLL